MTGPSGIGAQLRQPDRLRGWLVFDHLPPDMQTAEDETRYADMRITSARVRPATATELALLAHLGYDTSGVTQTVADGRYRFWPTLEDGPLTTGARANLLARGYTDPLRPATSTTQTDPFGWPTTT